MSQGEPSPPGTASAGTSRARRLPSRRRLSRRRLLRAGSLLGINAAAGCQWLTGTGPDRESGDEPTATVSPTAQRSTETTGRRDEIRFEGGGAAALSDALRAAEANPGSTLAIEPGTYRLDGSDVGHGQPHSHFTVDGLRDVTIEGNGARFVMADPTLGAIGFFNCEGLTLRNLALDYEPPPFTQGTITAVDDATPSLEVELHEGFPTFDEDPFLHPGLGRARRWGTVHDPETGNFIDERSGGATTVGFDDPERVGERRYRLSNLRPMRGVATGRLFVAVARLPFKHALLVSNCVEPTVEDVSIHATPAFAVLATVSESPTFRRVTVTPRPGSRRAVASNADGIHVLGCAPGPTIEDCHTERLQDDSYVVATLLNPVREVVDDRTVRVEPLIGTRIRPGDTIAGVDAEFDRLGTLPRVETVETNAIRLPGEWGRPTRVTFASSIDGTLGAGDLLRNVSRSNQGFAVRNCVSREIRSRHVRVTSRDGSVEGNELDGCATPAVMLAGGRFFSPQSPPENVAVRDNTITGAGLNGFTTPFRGAIDAWIHLRDWRDGTRPPGRPIRDLTITGNTIRRSAFKGVQVDDADGVTVADNVIEEPNLVGGDADAYGVGLVNDGDVRLVGNRVSGSSGDLDQFAAQADTDGLDVRDNALTIDGRSVPPDVDDAPRWH